MRFAKLGFTITLLAGALVMLPSVRAYTPKAVYGQPDYTSNAANQGGDSSAGTLSYPLGIAVDATRIYNLPTVRLYSLVRPRTVPQTALREAVG
jgi:hypothetical protein